MGNLLVERGSGGAGSPASVLKIGDLGGAACASSCVLKVGEQMSTAYVRAPEVILGCLKPLPAVDLWALGVVGAALLAGTSLFWSFPHEPGAQTASVVEVLARQVQFLGPIPMTPNPFQGFFTLASVSASYSEALNRKALHTSPAFYLEDKARVQQPLHHESAASRLLLSWLRWAPEERLAATEAVGHDLFAEEFDDDPILKLQVHNTSADVLGGLVLRSIRTGIPVTTAALVEAGKASSQAALLADPSPGPKESLQRSAPPGLDNKDKISEDTLGGEGRMRGHGGISGRERDEIKVEQKRDRGELEVFGVA